MPTNVVMPQMGESVAEGTVTKWLKKVGDRVEQDGRGALDRRVDEAATPLLAPAAFNELCPRTVRLIMHRACLCEARCRCQIEKADWRF